MPMQYNKSPISVREGKVFIDGEEVLDCVSLTITFTTDTWNGRILGEQTPNTRWLGYSISGQIVRRRSNKFLADMIAKYKASGETPEMTIQGIMDDTNSDYYAENGATTVTAVGCVLTGGFDLLSLNSDGQILDDTISFNAKDVIM